ncbi:MAG: hypothetical protein RL542_1645 [Bacteroidota bacterium]
MGIFSSISAFFKKKEKYPYTPRIIEKVILPTFFDERKIDNVYFRQFKNNNLKHNEVFNFGKDFVFYFDREESTSSNKFIRDNFITISEQFSLKGRNFYYIPFLIENRDDFIIPLLKECFPDFSELSYLTINENLKESFLDEESFFTDFFQFINYQGDIKRGCLSSNDGFTIVEHKDNETLEQFISDYITHLPTHSNNQYRFYSLDKKSVKTLQKETIESYDLIKSALEKLRNNGELLIVAPKLYKLLENNLKGIKFEDIAPITVTKDFKILISNNENLEIKLSHLTKTIYVFFLIQTEAIDIKDLKNHEKLLLSIYKNVSNQLSLDKMKESIQELVNPENESIYTHISRIKKEIQNHFEPHVAHQYFINGDKGKPKKINLSKDKISFEQPIL